MGFETRRNYSTRETGGDNPETGDFNADNKDIVEKTSLLERFRRTSLPVKALIFNIAVNIGSIGYHANEKFNEYNAIEKKLDEIRSRLTNLENSEKTLKDKLNKINNLFGKGVVFDFDEEKSFLERLEDDATSEQEGFRFMGEIRDIENLEETVEGKFRLVVSDFDIDNGKTRISAEEFGNTLKNMLPEQWKKGRVVVEQMDRGFDYKMPDIYDVSKDKPGKKSVVMATFSIRESADGSEYVHIRFFGPSYYIEEEKTVFDFAMHEFTHANDWRKKSSDYDLEHRVDWLLDVHNRVISEDRHRVHQVEIVSTENEKDGLYAKCLEYWASIVSVYFKDPSSLGVEDYELVRKYVFNDNKELMTH